MKGFSGARGKGTSIPGAFCTFFFWRLDRRLDDDEETFSEGLAGPAGVLLTG